VNNADSEGGFNGSVAAVYTLSYLKSGGLVIFSVDLLVLRSEPTVFLVSFVLTSIYGGDVYLTVTNTFLELDRFCWSESVLELRGPLVPPTPPPFLIPA
jgi:hypothetical protein